MIHSIQEMAANLKAARKKKGLSQRAVSSKIGVPQSHLSKIERGMVDLQTSTLIELARILDLEPMLISRSHISAVQALQNPSRTSQSAAIYQLDEEEDDGN